MSDIGETFKALREEQRDERDERVAAAHAHFPGDRVVIETIDGPFEVRWVDDYHAQAWARGRCVAQWWPSRGATMNGQRRGRRCWTGRDFEALVADAIAGGGR